MTPTNFTAKELSSQRSGGGGEEEETEAGRRQREADGRLHR